MRRCSFLLECKECEFTTWYPELYVAHLKTEGPNVYSCSRCGLETVNEGEMLDHMSACRSEYYFALWPDKEK